ncbi:MAG: carbamoyltransferase C-terminal domain-containing protein [Planctomycetota bacterium]|jgi:carbamoyltransferase|nr:carbamoyltransferase C-terminal domain-containing protein [Planctomycetota bacterium]
MARGLILGLNQYTHSAAACLLAADGNLLFAGEKERLTRKKHDGGDVAVLVEHALESVGATLDDVALVAANNHLFRIDRFHRTLKWDTALFSYQESYVSPYNLLPGVKRLELSHHMAHAWSVLPMAPFHDGVIVVMDGMGSTLHEMRMPGVDYYSELDLPEVDAFRSVPERLEQDGVSDKAFGWREGETAFTFQGTDLKRVFKRWIAEPTPALLHNYGFENMESLGAVYSRAASHIFGDWNTCGKVMGLAPWASSWAKDMPRKAVMTGPLETLQVDRARLRDEPAPNAWSDGANHAAYARFAADVQSDLEDVVLDYLKRLRQQTGAKNLAFCGGVALNSTLNGRIHREAGFEQVFIPPYPGDQGLAVGCAYFGLQWLQEHGDGDGACVGDRTAPMPYCGHAYSAADIDDAVDEYGPWLEEADIQELPLLEVVADALADNQVVAWCSDRSEFGPRALGNRSILADPRDGENIRRINTAIKKREAFRPFAPTVLADQADAWFDGVTPSPFMSLTVPVKADKAAKIPAVVHVDGSARIQTLERDAHPRYYALIEAFAERSGVPMVLNTSFNIKGEPIVETPREAAWSFLRSELDLLVMGSRLFRRRELPDPLTGDVIPRAIQNFSAEVVSDSEGETMAVRLMTRGETFDIDQLELGLLEAADGTSTLGEIVEFFQAEWDVEHADVIRKVDSLFQRCLLAIEPSA